MGGFQRIGLAVHPFGIHIYQSHLHRRQRIFQTLPVLRIFISFLSRRQPLMLRSPINIFFGMPNIFTAATKTQRLETHRLISHISGQNKQIGPRNFVSVFFLHRPKQPPCLVQIHIIRPTVQRCKTLIARIGTSPSVKNPVCSSRVPSHPDHQPGISAPIRRPPRLTITHQLAQIFFQSLIIQGLKSFPVVKIRVIRIGFHIVLMQNIQIQSPGPPLHNVGFNMHIRSVHNRAFSL